MTSIGLHGGAEGVLNTEWGDAGNFQTLSACYWSMALGAELSWNTTATSPSPTGGGAAPGRGNIQLTPSPSQGEGRGEGGVSDFDARFARAVFADRTGRMGQLYALLGRTNSVFTTLGYQGLPFVLYWADFPHATNWSKLTRLPEPSAADMRLCRQTAEQALALAKQIRRDPPSDVDDEILSELISAAEQTILACRKGALSLRVRAALRSRPSSGRAPVLSATLKRQVAKLAADWLKQKAEFQRVWMLRNEIGQIDYRLGLYDERYNDFMQLLGKAQK